MKKARSSSKPAAKDSAIRRAVGGQPENDQDAREAGLSSATSARGGGEKGSGARRPPRVTGSSKKKR